MDSKQWNKSVATEIIEDIKHLLSKVEYGEYEVAPEIDALAIEFIGNLENIIE